MSDCLRNGILFDHGRTARTGLPEAVFGEGKSPEALTELFEYFADEVEAPILFTRISRPFFVSLPEGLRDKYKYHPLSQTAFAATRPKQKFGRVAVVSAGTADAGTAWEAARTLEYLGLDFLMFEDNGVSGLWRLTSNLDEINSCEVIIVVAGLDAALASVMGGLTPRPVVAVPTSVGYGMAKNGEAALNSMLVSCAQGVTVMNIDNGFGAACAAARIISLITVSASAAVGTNVADLSGRE
ncbi:circadian phase modifier CpmA [Deltaproteobacteria bacterium Smac51]|nr:circadian phase modifier CpmA [Deltaproteobacteria bacterium Smac51]